MDAAFVMTVAVVVFIVLCLVLANDQRVRGERDRDAHRTATRSHR